MKALRFLLLILFSFTSVVDLFNVMIPQASILSTENVKEATSGGDGTSYFGYDMQFYESDHHRHSLLVGSPEFKIERSLTEDLSKKGSLIWCDLYQAFQTHTECEWRTPESESGGFGLSLTRDADNLRTNETEQCSVKAEDMLAVGRCFNTNDSGLNWRPDHFINKLVCRLCNLDIFFVLDGSTSIGDDFATVLDWVKMVASEIGDNNDRDGNNADRNRMGVIQYSHGGWKGNIKDHPNTRTETSLEEFINIQQFWLDVDKIKLVKGPTFTDHGMRKALYEFESNSNRDSSRRRIMILFTDGRASCNRFDLLQAANKLKLSGVVSIAVGVGLGRTGKKELQVIANYDKTRVFEIENFGSLYGIVDGIKRSINIALEGAFSTSGHEDAYSLKYTHAQFGFASATAVRFAQLSER